MAATVFDSPLFAKAYPTGEAARLFSDSAAVRAVLLVEGTLAKVQGELGLLPEDSAFFIHRSSMEVQIDPAGLANGLLTEGFVPSVSAAFAKAMEAPEHSKFIQHAADGAQIEAAALSLRLRQFLTLCEKRLAVVQHPHQDHTALKEHLNAAKEASVGLFLTTEAGVATALAEALRLPLRTEAIEIGSIGETAEQVCQSLARIQPENARLIQLHALVAALKDQPEDMTPLCLPQICLATASALELAIKTQS
ncbi:MAG: hypothetical protein JXQ85_08120 [Cognatishimia sp.]|uniref:hypothetical protein n=1 Tax=Cognatishimia sp. TaxID=2211648 RepID=UPI003B8E54DA